MHACLFQRVSFSRMFVTSFILMYTLKAAFTFCFTPHTLTTLKSGTAFILVLILELSWLIEFTITILTYEQISFKKWVLGLLRGIYLPYHCFMIWTESVTYNQSSHCTATWTQCSLHWYFIGSHTDYIWSHLNIDKRWNAHQRNHQHQ